MGTVTPNTPPATNVTLHDLNRLAGLLRTTPLDLLTPTQQNLSPPPVVPTHTARLSNRALRHLRNAIDGTLTATNSTNPTVHLNGLINAEVINVTHTPAHITYSVSDAIWHALDTAPQPPQHLDVHHRRSTITAEVLAAARRIHNRGHPTFTRHDILNDLATTNTKYAVSTIKGHVSRLTVETNPPLERVSQGTYRLKLT